LRLSSFGGYGLALAALALVVFDAYCSYPVSRKACVFFNAVQSCHEPGDHWEELNGFEKDRRKASKQDHERVGEGYRN